MLQLPKTNNFTKKLPPDAQYPTPSTSHEAERSNLGPRMVRGAAYTFVRPDPFKEPIQLAAVSSAALRDLAIDPASVDSDEFKETVSGQKIITINDHPEDDDIYPWAQCYGGYQFGQWAGQLGDGRAISLFETTNPETGVRYELQLKGAGRTPYSRFADGRAVVRSSIREFVVSEALNALGVPTTRALSLVIAPEAKIIRERIEPGAIVARFAQTWLRLGTFDLPRSRGDRQLIRKLADYTAEDVFGGWDQLVGKAGRDDIQGEGKEAQNRYARLYREVARRNAKMVAWWQAYGFTNGVLNTDNTSIFGLSIDFGPFAFLDTFDPNYTPNHDDFMLRYAYKNQPSIIWWNLLRFGEALGELIGAGPWCDDAEFTEKGVREEREQELIARAEHIIEQTGQEYKDVFMDEYKRLMTARLGLKHCVEGDFQKLYSELLDIMEAFELDFHHTFRKLSNINLDEIDSPEAQREVAGRFFPPEGPSKLAGSEEEARERLGKWLETWGQRVVRDWPSNSDDNRRKAMLAVNPHFIPRGWILDEVIDRAQKHKNYDLLARVMKMTLNPFEETWEGIPEDEVTRFCSEPPPSCRALQCSCSS
ncbi:UPF0061-domain-containing protein [Piedraia hortae CBS 480.64]|uniref:Selenoprotein O n=1 Tax=Piedraia hortae CBS 480.64 TaxID=1314780 RepID=A0A6A7BVI6_9PEZI|nr:UPF0061-domain-containing protein [Piedraia hortae CBS 480.64]